MQLNNEFYHFMEVGSSSIFFETFRALDIIRKCFVILVNLTGCLIQPQLLETDMWVFLKRLSCAKVKNNTKSAVLCCSLRVTFQKVLLTEKGIL